jgi:hypothetical protein
MAHWARINEDSIVEQVIVTSNEDIDEGAAWVAENLEGVWLKTSYNTSGGRHVLGGEPFRKNFAQPGYFYNDEIDGFVPPKQEFETSFILNHETGFWMPADPFPVDADCVIQYGAPIPLVDEIISLDDGTEATIKKPDISPDAKVYFWVRSENTWGMNPNSDYPKPEGDYFWHPIENECQTPTVEKPADNYYWDVFEKQWVEIPAPPTE